MRPSHLIILWVSPSRDLQEPQSKRFSFHRRKIIHSHQFSLSTERGTKGGRVSKVDLNGNIRKIFVTPDCKLKGKKCEGVFFILHPFPISSGTHILPFLESAIVSFPCGRVRKRRELVMCSKLQNEKMLRKIHFRNCRHFFTLLYLFFARSPKRNIRIKFLQFWQQITT